MPNSRRRKFSVQSAMLTKETRNLQTELETSQDNFQPDERKINSRESESFKKLSPDINGQTSTLEIIPESISSISVLSINKATPTADDTVTSVSDIKSSGTVIAKDRLRNEAILDTTSTISKRRMQYERNGSQMEKRPHRIKVRSPKRRCPLIIDVNKNKRSVGVTTDAEQNKTQYSKDHDIETNECLIEVERLPETSGTDDMCRICHGGDIVSPEFGRLISACACRGTIGRVHVICLETWLTESGKSRCELCSTRYSTRRVHKYGVFKALILWLLSQNAKQLMVDGLGTLLMSPLAMLAAWLSGRTLVSLMAQEEEMAPWPLASTFVLACTTLVCYYCWIVSAATRHALSWWIWYRSQYEVKLQLEDQ